MTTRWAKLFTEGKKILGWLKSSFRLFCKMVQKTRWNFLVNPVLPQTFRLGTHQPRLYPGYDDSSFLWVQRYLLKPQVHFCSLFFLLKLADQLEFETTWDERAWSFGSWIGFTIPACKQHSGGIFSRMQLKCWSHGPSRKATWKL